MPDFRGFVPAMLIAGAIAGFVGAAALYAFVDLLSHISITWR